MGGWSEAFREVSFKALAFSGFGGYGVLKALEAFRGCICGKLDLFVDDGGDGNWWWWRCFDGKHKGRGIGGVFEALFGGNSTDVEGNGIVGILVDVGGLSSDEAVCYDEL